MAPAFERVCVLTGVLRLALPLALSPALSHAG
jgi:hypothetical protein